MNSLQLPVIRSGAHGEIYRVEWNRLRKQYVCKAGQDWAGQRRSGIPAMDDHRSSVGELHLLGVDLREEAEDASWLAGHAVVRPAQVLVLPDGPRRLRLDTARDGSEPFSLPEHKHTYRTLMAPSNTDTKTSSDVCHSDSCSALILTVSY